MKLFRMIRDAFSGRSLRRQISSRSYPSRSDFWDAMIDMVGIRGGVPVLRNPYVQNPWVYACVNAIARNFKRVPLRLMTGDPEGENKPMPDDHEIVTLFKKPNAITSRARLLERHSKQRFLRGGSGWILLNSNRQPVESDTEIPVEIWNYPINRFEPVKNDDGMTIAGWKFKRRNKADIPLKFHQVVMFRFEDPDEPLQTIAPLSAAMIAIGQHFEMDKWNEAIFQNDGTPPFVVSLDGSYSPKQKREMREDWNDQHAGSWKKGKPAFLSHNAKINKVADSHRDMQFLEGRQDARKQTQVVFGVNDVELGLPQDVNRATALAFKKLLFEAVIIPEQTELTDELSPHVRRWTTDRKLYVWFDNSKVEALKQGYTEQIDQAEKLQARGFSLRQIMERLDLGMSIDDMPEEIADLHLVNTGLQNMDGLVALPEEDEPAPPPVPPPAPPPAKDAPDLETRDAGYWDKTIKENFNPIEKRFVAHLNRVWRDLRAETLKNLAKIAKVPVAAGSKDDLPLSARMGPPDIELILFDLKIAEEAVRKRLASDYAKAFEMALDSLEADLGKLTSVSQNTAELVAFVEWKKLKVKRVAKTVHRRLRAQIKKSIQQKQTVQQLAARIRRTFSIASASSLRIARTETAGTWNGVRHIGMIEEGVKKHRWITARDEHVRKSHAKNGGVVREIGKEFPNGLIHAHDPDAPAGEVINCRVLNTPVV